jgi:hypothetical protein
VEFFRNLPADAIVNMTTKAGDLAVTFCPSGTSGFAGLKRDAIDIQAADRLHILIASLEDVIRSKAAAGREKDRLALPRLRRLLDRLQADEWLLRASSPGASRIETSLRIDPQVRSLRQGQAKTGT